MADFVAVLRRTIGSLGENTPAMREKVFDKARSTIEAKLRAIDPPPPAAVVERQKKALEDAIATVRADYAEPPSVAKDEDIDDPLESVFAALDQPSASPARAAADSPSASATGSPAPVATPLPSHDIAQPKPEAPETTRPAADFPDAPGAERAVADVRPPRHAGRQSGSGGGGRKGLVAALAIILLAGAGGFYVWWSGADTIPAVTQAPAPDENAPDENVQEPAATTVEDLTEEPEDAASLAQATEQAAAPEPAAPAANGPEKFTQRLLPDGSEVDDGPAGGEPRIGEGSSIAALAQPPATPDATLAAGEAQSPTEAESAAASGAADEEQAAATETPPPAAASDARPAAVTVGQRAIFYEERTSTAEGSAEMGSIAWSLVEESPGGDLPPEPAIRAEAMIPGKDVQLRMTIRRNGDQTLPASHIVEMIFLTPDGFEGGGVSNVSRIAFKETEQAPGSPLIGIPAKIADGFFLIALSDAPAETQANLTLLRRQSWLDIPIVYQSGQRALLSLEKGIPGDRVFQEALDAWSEAGSG